MTVYGARRHRARRRRVLLGAVLGLLLVTVLAGAGHPLGGKAHPRGGEGRTSLSPVSWPAQGQAALALGNGRPAASPHEQPVPIASLAEVAGSRSRFVAAMNAQAHALGMDHTSYTDPSGFDPSTVSTAADQLRLFEHAMRFPTFRQIVSMPSVTLPVAGTLSNYDPLTAEGYAGKTGSDPAAGGCQAFFTDVTVGERRVTAVGVVLGQGQGRDTSVLLAAAGEAAAQLVESVLPAAGVRAIAASGPAGARRRDAGGRRVRLPAAPGPASTQP